MVNDDKTVHASDVDQGILRLLGHRYGDGLVYLESGSEQHLLTEAGEPRRPSNQIIIEIAPRGGVSLRFEGKVPGIGMHLDTVAMDFDYAKRFGSEPIEAYGPLILDAMRGDQTLFQHRYEVEGAWRAIMPLIGPDSASIRQSIHANYDPGSWGPASSDRLLAGRGRAWHNAETE